MHVQITARHFKLTDSLRTYVEDRVSRLERYYDGITTASVILDLGEGTTDERIAEIALGVYRQTLTCRETAETHEEAVNQCTANLKRQILRYKDKLRGKHKYQSPAERTPESIESIEVTNDE